MVSFLFWGGDNSAWGFLGVSDGLIRLGVMTNLFVFVFSVSDGLYIYIYSKFPGILIYLVTLLSFC